MGNNASPGIISRYILLSDIAHSSKLAEEFPQKFTIALDRHNALVERAVLDNGGEIYKNTGNGFFAFFDTADGCIACAHAMALAFAQFPAFAKDDPFHVRITAHYGEMRAAGNEFFGPGLNRASRLCQVCHPGQVIFSKPAKPAETDLPDGAFVIDLGEHHLRDLAEPEHLYQLNSAGLPNEFPALETLNNRPHNLWQHNDNFIGRECELVELTHMLVGRASLPAIPGSTSVSGGEEKGDTRRDAGATNAEKVLPR